MRCMQNLGKHAPVLLLVPICLNLASQIITCYCGNVKTKYLKYFNILKMWFLSQAWMLQKWWFGCLKKALLCRTNKLLARFVFFFLFFFPLWVVLICICVNQKKKVRPVGLCWQVAGASKRQMGAGVSDGTRLFPSAPVSKCPLFQGCSISKAIKLRNAADFPHS